VDVEAAVAQPSGGAVDRRKAGVADDGVAEAGLDTVGACRHVGVLIREGGSDTRRAIGA